jgi:hypothetical protein
MRTRWAISRTRAIVLMVFCFLCTPNGKGIPIGPAASVSDCSQRAFAARRSKGDPPPCGISRAPTKRINARNRTFRPNQMVAASSRTRTHSCNFLWRPPPVNLRGIRGSIKVRPGIFSLARAPERTSYLVQIVIEKDRVREFHRAESDVSAADTILFAFGSAALVSDNPLCTFESAALLPDVAYLAIADLDGCALESAALVPGVSSLATLYSNVQLPPGLWEQVEVANVLHPQRQVECSGAL